MVIGVKRRPTSSLQDTVTVRLLCQKLQRRGFNGDGRTDRASLQPLYVGGVQRGIHSSDLWAISVIVTFASNRKHLPYYVSPLLP